MEVFIRECEVQVQGLDRSQEFRVLYESAKVEQKTSKIGIILVKI